MELVGFIFELFGFDFIGDVADSVEDYAKDKAVKTAKKR